MQNFEKYWYKNGKTKKDINDLYHQMKIALTYNALAYLDYFPKQEGYYQNFGVDFVVDEDFNVKFLEFNY